MTASYLPATSAAAYSPYAPWGAQVSPAFAVAANQWLAGQMASPYAMHSTGWSAASPWSAPASAHPDMLTALARQAQFQAQLQASAVAFVQMQNAAARGYAPVAGAPAAPTSAYAATTAPAAGLPPTATAAQAQLPAAIATAVAPTVRRAANAIEAHVSQVVSRFNPNAPAGNRDCGPASVVMTLRMLGLRIPGASPRASAQQLVDGVRGHMFGTRNIASVRGETTTNHQIEAALKAAGAAVTTSREPGSLYTAARDGTPVILNGNAEAAGSYGGRIADKDLVPYDGAHWIVVSGYDPATRMFVINDPMSKAGPLKVTMKELEAYRGGSLGLITQRAAA